MSTAERRVLVTGASGFLGGHAVREFADHGDSVIATGRNARALATLEGERVTTLAASLDDLAGMRLPVDTIVHAAALSSPWGRWKDFAESNVRGTEAMIDFAQRNGAKRFVFVSSPSIYSGRRHRLDIREDDVDPHNRLNHYIRSKLIAEALLRTAHDEGRLPELVIIRPRGLIGVGDPSLIPRLLTASRTRGIPLFNDGRNLVDITCVENVALALRLAADPATASGGVYNITNGEPIAFRELLEMFFAALGEEPRYLSVDLRVLYAAAAVLERVYALSPSGAEPPVTRYTVATLAYSQTLDISRATAELGYRPRVSLREGIENVAAHYRARND